MQGMLDETDPLMHCKILLVLCKSGIFSSRSLIDEILLMNAKLQHYLLIYLSTLQKQLARHRPPFKF